ncbi:ABC transporter ATP-binding protein/permease [Methylocella silvestris]|uniref:Glycosyl transferase family 1 n=1 Tax=Methylocella silvestris TaxID=199596 RepID=A0A2J7TGY4_METSI|nr:ABC transporter ATP-binding protein/permease [Methylocella silvestris]PNG26028.1 glycosyl transferase family 1 [Methylocella silvestris]
MSQEDRNEGQSNFRDEGFATQLLGMARSLMAAPERNQFLLLAFALCAVVGATAFGQIKLNAWNHPFYDALARKDMDEFVSQLWNFAFIAGGLLILNVAQIWLNQMTKLKLRSRLTRNLIDLWLGPTRAFRLANAGEIGVNPDQRIHEDARHLVELTTDLGVGLLQATLLLVCFIGVLWVLSEGVALTLFGYRADIPGYMVWAALLYSGAASWMSWRVGRPLIAINAERYSREADLRFALVRANERNDAIAFYGGEEDEKQRLRNELEPVLSIMRRLVSGVTRLTWVTAGYGWFTIVAPIVVAAPGFFSGDLSLGGLMMVVGAFNQVQLALRWFVDNFSVIADWRATMIRISTFRRALIELDNLGDKTGRIDRVVNQSDMIQFDDLRVSSASTCTRLSERHVTIKPGERILIIARSSAGRSNFFCAIAGLWPWGAGRISVPEPASMMFMSSRPYLPPGSLRTTLAYPAPVSNFPETAFAEALDRIGLSHLKPGLDSQRRWDRELGGDEQQSLHFARLLLHKPRWILINEALDALDEETRAIVLDIFTLELAGATVLNVGRPDTQNGFFARVLHLIDDPGGERLAPRPEAPAIATSPGVSVATSTNASYPG